MKPFDMEGYNVIAGIGKCHLKHLTQTLCLKNRLKRKCFESICLSVFIHQEMRLVSDIQMYISPILKGNASI